MGEAEARVKSARSFIYFHFFFWRGGQTANFLLDRSCALISCLLFKFPRFLSFSSNTQVYCYAITLEALLRDTFPNKCVRKFRP